MKHKNDQDARIKCKNGMICDIVESARAMNNLFSYDNIPYDYLTRKESDTLIDLELLENLKIPIVNRNIPFEYLKPEQQMILDYQQPCLHHLQEAFTEYTKKHDYIYISMIHFKDLIKQHAPNFYYSQYYKHLHFVLVGRPEEHRIQVKAVEINDRTTFMMHQTAARQAEKHFNLKYHLQEHYDCTDCLPTLCGLALYYKPKCIADVPTRYNNSLLLIKNDRIRIGNICEKALQKWHIQSHEEYLNKMYDICAKREWSYEKIITYIHKTHYGLFKASEWQRDRNMNDTAWIKNKRNIHSPTWRSNLTTVPFCHDKVTPLQHRTSCAWCMNTIKYKLTYNNYMLLFSPTHSLRINFVTQNWLSKKWSESKNLEIKLTTD